MLALVIVGWMAVAAVTYFVAPFCPLPRGMIMTKVFQWQATLAVAGWTGKFFAGLAYFIAGSMAAVGICVVSLGFLFSVIVLGLINRNPMSRSDMAAKLRKQIAELEG